MSSIGTGYDLSASTYSPDGRIFQVEYALKAVELSGTSIGIKCKDGVVMGTEKLVLSKLLTPTGNKRIQSADLHIGITCSGLFADARHVVNRAREEAKSHLDTYRAAIPGKIMAERLGQYIQAHTLYSSIRPFGVGVLVGVVDEFGGPQLYMIEPSGVYWGYNACAIGKGKQIAKAELEKLDLKTITVKQAVREIAKILHIAHDESKDRAFELELSWICQESGMKHALIPADVLADAQAFAQDALRDEMQD